MLFRSEAEPRLSTGQRLSRSGQILVGVGVSLVALLLYGLTLEWDEQRSG